jgi:hypothetical protein
MVDTSPTPGIRSHAPSDVRRDRYYWTTEDMLKNGSNLKQNQQIAGLNKTANSYPFLHAKTGNVYRTNG